MTARGSRALPRQTSLRRLCRSVTAAMVRVFGPAAPLVAASWFVQVAVLAYCAHVLAAG